MKINKLESIGLKDITAYCNKIKKTQLVVIMFMV